MTGWQCLDVLRADDRTARLPVLVLTAAVDDVHKLARPPADCTAYLVKPFDVDDLLAAIHGVIETCTRETVMV
jgi:CheY-like chemotaxis protein